MAAGAKSKHEALLAGNNCGWGSVVAYKLKEGQLKSAYRMSLFGLEAFDLELVPEPNAAPDAGDRLLDQPLFL